MKLSGISSILKLSNTLKRKYIKRSNPVQQRQDSKEFTLCQVYSLRELVPINAHAAGKDTPTQTLAPASVSPSLVPAACPERSRRVPAFLTPGP
jgi:hypothetical protein